MTKFTREPWRIGFGHSVVADHEIGPEMPGADKVEYYNGHMVCESVTTANRLLIAKAPELYLLLKQLVHEGPSIPVIAEAKRILKEASPDDND